MKLVSLIASILALGATVLGDPNFKVDYSIKESPESTATDVVEFFNGDSITLVYTVSNDDEAQIGVIGVGGHFLDAKSNEINTNITGASVGPIILEPGQSQQFSQVIKLNLIPDSYILAPLLYISVGEEFLTVNPRHQYAVISDLPVSWFNPQLIFLEIVLVGTFTLFAYAVYELFGKKYFAGTAPVTSASKRSKKTPEAVDSSWIPEHHLKSKKKQY